MSFDREAFLKGKLNPSGGTYWKAPSGLYNVELDSVSYGKSKSSNAEGVTFIWKIASDHFEFPNKKIYHSLWLQGTDSKVNDIAYSQLCGIFETLGYIPDDVTFANDVNKGLQPLVGSKIVLLVEPGKDPKFQNFKIHNVIESSVSDQTTVVPFETNLNSPLFSVGDTIAFRDAYGDHSGKVKFIHPNGEIIVYHETSKKDIACKATDCWLIGQTPPETLQTKIQEVEKDEPLFDDTPENLEETIDIEVGMTVKARYNGKDFVGKVHELIEKDGQPYVRVAYNGKAYPCKLEDISLP